MCPFLSRCSVFHTYLYAFECVSLCICAQAKNKKKAKQVAKTERADDRMNRLSAFALRISQAALRNILFAFFSINIFFVGGGHK